MAAIRAISLVCVPTCKVGGSQQVPATRGAVLLRCELDTGEVTCVGLPDGAAAVYDFTPAPHRTASEWRPGVDAAR